MEWKPIVGFTNYEVSSEGGRIRNVRTGKELSKWVHKGRRYACYRVSIIDDNGKKLNRVSVALLVLRSLRMTTLNIKHKSTI